MATLKAAAAEHPKRKRSSTEQVVPGLEGGGAEHDSFRMPTGGCILDPLEDPDYPIPGFERIYAQMRHPGTGLKVADRRWRLLTYSKCFTGQDAVQWMVDNLNVTTAKAVSYGQSLMNAGIIHHVTHSEPFTDQYYFYRFQEDNDTNVLNMKRIWDPAIPTRSALEASQRLLTKLACLCEEYRQSVISAKEQCSAEASPNLDEAGKAAHRNRNGKAVLTTDSKAEAVVDAGIVTETCAGASYGILPAATFMSPLLATVQGKVAQSLSPFPTAGNTPSAASFASPSLVRYSSSHPSVGDEVDYTLLAKSEDFRQYTLAAAELQQVQLVGLSQDELLAFFVNAYNTLCLHGYVINGPPSNLYRRFCFFRQLSYRIAGLDMTLDDIEHGILRGNKKPPMLKFMQQLRPSDPRCQYILTKRDRRIHFVISAGTRSDPPVRILNGENVREELHDATVEFLGCSVKVDPSRRTVTLPRIFLWYADDFPTPETALLHWVSSYIPVERSDQLRMLLANPAAAPSVVYENFDWNSADARFNAAAIRRKRRKLEKQFAPNTNQMLFGTNGFTGQSPILNQAIGIQGFTTPLLGNHPLYANSPKCNTVNPSPLQNLLDSGPGKSEAITVSTMQVERGRSPHLSSDVSPPQSRTHSIQEQKSEAQSNNQ